jgi:hypothetical protein
LEDLGVNGRIILKWILRKLHRAHGLDSSGSVQGTVAGACKCGNPGNLLTSRRPASFSVMTLFHGVS